MSYKSRPQRPRERKNSIHVARLECEYDTFAAPEPNTAYQPLKSSETSGPLPTGDDDFAQERFRAETSEAFMHMDVVLLSRIQFALTLMFHYLFPPLTIGLGLFLVLVEGVWMATGNVIFKEMAQFWTKLFAVNFAIGVATGIVMEFQFGTNWAVYSRFVGDVFGSALAAEGIFAFFLESGFLSVVVFGWDRVSARMHYFATWMVALGSIFSSVWITIANSWQQTPAGYHLVKTASGFVRAEITDFWAMVFNPSSMYRLCHVWLGAFILGAFFTLSIAAYYLLRNKHQEFAKNTFLIALIYAALASCSELVSGHMQARAVARNQPAKLAALEAHYKTGTAGSELYLFGIPNPKKQEVDFGLALPNFLSILVYDDPNKPVAGLDKFREEDWPPVVIPFLSYHVMIALGMMFIGLSLLGLFLYWRGTLFQQKWLLWCYVFAVLGGYAANETGWVCAEVGRQPWLVYGLLRTTQGVSPRLAASHVLASIIMFAIVYLFLFAVWVFVLNDKIQHGPELSKTPQPTTDDGDTLLKVASRMFEHGRYSLTGTPSEPQHGSEEHLTGQDENNAR
jgi:cytochrome d ubiquinol oxidase subunit I